MIELPLVFVGGLLGSGHCAGMCGGFAVTLGGTARSWRANLARQAVYGVGRIFTYAALGAAAGYGGLRLVAASALVDGQALVAVVAGLLLLFQGLKATGVLRKLGARNAERGTNGRVYGSALPACASAGLLGSLLRTAGLTGPFLAGVVTGFLPCGLVYAMLALAATSASVAGGMAVMAVFGLGTLPIMTTLGLGTSLVGLAARARVLRFAAWCLVLAGGWSIARGAYAFTTPHAAPPNGAAAEAPACPLCAEK